MKAHSARRVAQCCLARMPHLYSRILVATRRGLPEKRRYLKLIRRGEVIFDVGANVGYFTLLFSDLVGPKGSVHAFEPVEPTFERVSHRVRSESCYPNVLLNLAACSEKAGVAEIIVPDEDFGQASMRAHQNGSWSSSSAVKTYSAPAIKLDDYVAEKKLNAVDFIKCDAEGAELLVLKGAANVLVKHRPLLSLEVADFWMRDFGYGLAELADFLIACGYSNFAIEEKLVTARDFPSSLAERARTKSLQVICAGGENAGRIEALA
jgi:FkbM family methyltransferase